MGIITFSVNMGARLVHVDREEKKNKVDVCACACVSTASVLHVCEQR